MKIEVNRDYFVDTFRRSHDYNKFSYSALHELFDWYEELEDSTGESIEFDYIAIACDWSEYESIAEAYRDHYGDDSDLPEEQRRVDEDQQREYFEDNTTIIEFDEGVLIMQF